MKTTPILVTFTFAALLGGAAWLCNSKDKQIASLKAEAEAAKLQSERNVAVALKDGWTAYAIDSMAIQQYHSRADELPDDDDPKALADIWADCVFTAKHQEDQWNTLTADQKLSQPGPFWKSGKGEPRRLSRSLLQKMKDAAKVKSP